MSISINKQVQTERGLVFIKEAFENWLEAEKAGYYPAFYSSKLKVELSSKMLDNQGHRYDFAIIGGVPDDLA